MSYNPQNDPRINIPLTELDLGFFVRIKIMPCSINPFVAAECILPELLKAFIGFEGPDPKHILHEISGRSFLKGARLLMEDMEILEPEVGDLLDEVTRMVWKINADIDEGIWYLFLVALAAEFFIDWSTEVYRLNGCTSAGMQGWIRSGDNQCVYTTGIGWTECCLFENCTGSDNNYHTAGSEITIGSTEAWSLQCTSEWQDVGGNPIPTTMRIYDATADATLDSADAFGSLFTPTTWSMVAVYDQQPFQTAHTIKIQAQNAGPTSVNEVFGKRGGYFEEHYTNPQTPISADWRGPFLPNVPLPPIPV